MFRESLEQMERVEQGELIDLVLRRHFLFLYVHHREKFLPLLMSGAEVTCLNCSEEICSGPAFAGLERF